VSVAARDPVLTLYRTLLAYGGIGIVILVLGLVEFLHFEPYNLTAAASVHVVGVFSYDPDSHMVSGPDRGTFSRNEDFAAVVDWSGLPDNITVRAVWYDSFENIVGSVGPGKPSDLKSATVIPAAVPPGLKYHLPGQYIFVVERLEGVRPVEVLARRVVLVQRS
jgi:hypothetical protein